MNTKIKSFNISVMLYGVLKLFCFVGLKRRNGLPQPLHGFAMTREGKRIAARLATVSPAGSVGASALQRCPPDTRTAMTKRCVGTRTARKSGAGIGYIIIRGCIPLIKGLQPRNI